MTKARFLFFVIMVMGLSAWVGAALLSQEPAWKDMKASGKKNWIDDSMYFTFTTNETPKMGTIILKVQVFSKSGEKDRSFVIKGRFDMPAMAGDHDSGLQTLSLNKAGNYLLPLNIVMPGEWELQLTFLKGDKTVYRGRSRFNV